jgi:hypothetical protein
MVRSALDRGKELLFARVAPRLDEPVKGGPRDRRPGGEVFAYIAPKI